MTDYQPTDEQIEALAIQEFHRRGPDGPYGLPWKKAPELDKNDYRNSARAHAASPAFQSVIRAAQAEALRTFRQAAIDEQLETYGIVLSEVDSIIDALDESADAIEAADV